MGFVELINLGKIEAVLFGVFSGIIIKEVHGK